MRVLLTVVTGFMVKGELRESRERTEIIDVGSRSTTITQAISEEVGRIRRMHATTKYQPDILSVSHSVLP